MPTVLKLSRQRQLTLNRAIVAAMGNPRFLEARLNPDRSLTLIPADRLDLREEVPKVYREAGITKDVLIEALRIVQRREKARAAGAGRTEDG
ncbi:hypothetical protein [Elioraea tepidiphila]|jgi:hypothetical protein|uniref:hypothetical protein n=1 Tax=Elioraea tepidiphila TaxID=457934 RepID=UPI00036627F3|nr:hypothetical protein [Elioraea tepidiphila]